MIEAARRTHPYGAWITGDARSWRTDEPFDLVSNAMLQWLRDHRSVCRHRLEQVAPGGALAVQPPVH